MMRRWLTWLAALLLAACAGARGTPPRPDAAVDSSIKFPDACIPACAGRNCGDVDGCGGVCDGPCPSGQVCQQGKCTCTAQSCSTGCCAGGTCFPGTADDHCGTSGGPCVDCLTQGQSCGAAQTCFACQPDCAGKACGAANGCGGTCSTGICPAGQVCSGGACVCTPQSCPTGCCDLSHTCQPGLADTACGTTGALCQDCTAQTEACSAGVCQDCSRWDTSLPALVQDLAVDKKDDTIYVTGQTGGTPGKIYLAALDHCGAVLRSGSHLPAGATQAGGKALDLLGNDIIVGGTLVPGSGGDPQQGLYGRFDKQSLTASWTTSLYGSTGKDEIWDIVPAGGAIWMSGTSGFDTTGNTWGVKGAPGTPQACGFNVAGSGSGRRITAPAGSGHVYLTGHQAGKGLVARYSDTACATSSCGTCTPGWQTTFQVGAATTEGRGLLVAGGNVYVAGYAVVSGQDLQAFVVRLDLATGTVQDTYLWNPTADAEMFMDLATDGTSLYVAGMQGYDGSTAQAAVHALSMPKLTKQWDALPGDVGAYWAVTTVGSDGLLLAGASLTGGFVRRCLTSGLCP